MMSVTTIPMPISKRRPIILGIDPGLATTGYGIIQEKNNGFTVIDAGTINTPAREAFGQRLETIYDDMTTLLKKYTPDIVGIEQLFFAKNVTTAFSVGQARGVMLLAAWQHKCTIKEFTPLQVKQAVTGYGKANKTQMQKMMKMILQLKKIPQPDDVADALAVAVCSAQTKIPT